MIRENERKMAHGLGWTLVAVKDLDGEVSLQVADGWGRSGSLIRAVNEGEVYDHSNNREVRLKKPTLALFDRWMAEYDAICKEAF